MPSPRRSIARRRDKPGAPADPSSRAAVVLWSQAWDEMRAFVEKAGIPFYPPRRGAASSPTTTPYSYLTMRNDAFREADLIIILGTRTNYVIGHALPPRFSAHAKGLAHRHRPRGDGQFGAQHRLPHRRRLANGYCSNCARRSRRAPPTASSPGARSWLTARRRSACAPAATTRPTATFIHCGCARRSRTSCSARPSCRSTGRRS